MVVQYPHFLFVKNMGGNSVQNPDGSWSNPDAESWMFHTVCREETNGKGSTIQGADGKAIVYSSTIQMPRTASRITEGTTVLVSESKEPEGVLRIAGKVLKFDNGQMHARAWI